MNPRFYFSTCQAGAEKAVKAEVLSEYPQLRFSFSRPGFVTFKEPSDELPALGLRRGVFTRLWGEVLGQATDRAALRELIASVPIDGILQCFDRDLCLPGDEPPGFQRHGRIRAIAEGEPRLGAGRLPRIGSEVYSLVWVDDFRVFLTRHVHAEHMSTSPGNIPDISLPADSPSRSYLKIEEAIRRFQPEAGKDIEALEVGCAPGGATTAMLDRGMSVTGVDPQHMDARVCARSGFASIRKMARYLVAEDIRSVNPDWLVMDMNIAPPEALAELSHVVATLRSAYADGLRLGQGFLTLKLNDWSLAREIPLYLERLEKIGFGDLHPVQLCANRREFLVWAARFS